MLTRHRPKAVPVGGVGLPDFYVPEGDALGYRYICEYGYLLLTQLPPLVIGEQIRVRVNISQAMVVDKAEVFKP